MARDIALTKLRFGAASFLMESVLDPWGEDDPIVEMAINGKFDEFDSLLYWAFLAQSSVVGDLFLDVGSYSGLFSLLGAKTSPGARFALFEASTVTYGRAVRNIILNSIEAQICAANFAAWDEEQVLEFPHRYGIYSMCPGESASSTLDAADHSERVIAIPLDALLRTHPHLPGPLGSKALGVRSESRISGIKIDVEGAEEAVLRGAETVLREHRPIIICEILNDDRYRSITALLAKKSYKVRRIANERNYLLIPIEREVSFETQYCSWREKANIRELKAERVIVTRPSAFMGS